MSHTINVPISYQQTYAINIGSDTIWNQLAEFIESDYSSQRAFFVVDENVHRLHQDRIFKKFSHYFEHLETFVVPAGEKSKSIEQWQEIIDFILSHHAERSTPLFAIGGGVTGDLGGFAASTALRGLPLIHLPTSLLAMVDSSIGGKTGVNHRTGKNLVGAFYQPDAVFTDLQFLETLDKSEWINGLSEILKYGAIHSPEIFDKAEDLIDEPGFTPGKGWEKLIGQSAAIKVEVVSEDTLEAGKRAFLNFGHTFGHALEKVSGYGEISHGQAVFVGMVAAIYASGQLGADIDSARLEPFNALYPIGLQSLVPQKGALVEAMKADKKVKEGKIRLILLKDWGQPFIHTCDGTELIEEAWSFVYEHFR